MSCDKSVGLWSVNTHVNFGLPESIRNGSWTSVSNSLYSVTQCNSSACYRTFPVWVLGV